MKSNNLVERTHNGVVECCGGAASQHKAMPLRVDHR